MSCKLWIRSTGSGLEVLEVDWKGISSTGSGLDLLQVEQKNRKQKWIISNGSRGLELLEVDQELIKIGLEVLEVEQKWTGSRLEVGLEILEVVIRSTGSRPNMDWKQTGSGLQVLEVDQMQIRSTGNGLKVN